MDDWATANADERTVTAQAAMAEDLAMIRRLVIDVCSSAGLEHDRCLKLSLATNEITTNAIEHGGGDAHVVITAGIAGVSVEVNDHGPGLPSTAPQLPQPTTPHGRGLWLADQLCDRLEVSSTTQGTTVRLIMNR